MRSISRICSSRAYDALPVTISAARRRAIPEEPASGPAESAGPALTCGFVVFGPELGRLHAPVRVLVDQDPQLGVELGCLVAASGLWVMFSSRSARSRVSSSLIPDRTHTRKVFQPSFFAASRRR